MSSTEHTVQSLAAEANGWLTRVKRDDGRSVVVAKDGAPDWLTDLFRAAHGGGGPLMMPDDWRYEFIEDSLNALESGETDPPDLDSAYPYTHDRTGWLNSRTDRYGYCDEAAEDYGQKTGDVMELIALGMARELDEVFRAIESFLEERADELNDAAEAEDDETAAG